MVEEIQSRIYLTQGKVIIDTFTIFSRAKTTRVNDRTIVHTSTSLHGFPPSVALHPSEPLLVVKSGERMCCTMSIITFSNVVFIYSLRDKSTKSSARF